jgi:integrase
VEEVISFTVTNVDVRRIKDLAANVERAPTIVNLTVKRRYLTEREVERLMDCARKYGRYGHRDATMILVAYRHGLRASEVCDLQWQQIELSEGRHRRRSNDAGGEITWPGPVRSIETTSGDALRFFNVRRNSPAPGLFLHTV